MTVANYRVKLLVEGMTCKHCVASVEEEVGELGGVVNVQVDLNSGAVSEVVVTSTVPLDEEAVRDAVTEAGFVLKDMATI